VTTGLITQLIRFMEIIAGELEETNNATVQTKCGFLEFKVGHTHTYLQGDSRGKVNILGGDSIGQCKRNKEIRTNTYMILSGWRDTSF